MPGEISSHLLTNWTTNAGANSSSRKMGAQGLHARRGQRHHRWGAAQIKGRRREKRDGRVAEEDHAHFERGLGKLTAALLGRRDTTTAARYLWRR